MAQSRRRLTASSRVRNVVIAIGALLVTQSIASGCKAPVQQSNSEVRSGDVDQAFKGKGVYPIWAYDPGPDPQSPMDRQLIDLNADIPSFPEMSEQIYGDQMFRPAFGPIPWRMMLKPNSIKILFIGQDGTHIAEAANRPATAGFGGRAQDLAQYFGVTSSAAFINAYAFTIRWQYGAFDTPIIKTGNNGSKQLSFGSFTGNQIWLISQDQDSPLVKWRNSLIEWIIRNNRDSLKLVVLFGGAARDAMASFVVSKGGKVGSMYDESGLSRVKIPEFNLLGAGSNKQTATPFASDGSDLLKSFKGGFINYKDPNTVAQVHSEFQQAFAQDPEKWARQMVMTNGGLNGSGMIHPAQLGGYWIEDKMEIKDEDTNQWEKTISLKNLRLGADFKIDHDILVTQLPHPTALSMMSKQEASKKVEADLVTFERYVKSGWTIEPDPGLVNEFATAEPCEGGQQPGWRPGCFKYGRADMGTEYYDFGAPNSRMVNVSTASRDGANVIVFGTRDRVRFDENAIKSMTFAKPAKMPSDEEMWTAKPRSQALRAVFDPGPGEKYAKLMKSTLPRTPDFMKRHEINGDFGHYRGTFVNPQVFILADPDGDDDLNTSRALTGARGQYLHGLMEDLGVGDKYLVLKTAPYSMYPSKMNDWQEIMSLTSTYRETVIREIMNDGTPKLIIADGPYAAQEIQRILPNPPAPVVVINRQGNANNSGIAEAMGQIKQVGGFQSANASLKMADLPRTHLTFYARMWEGTSGDRVITSNDPAYIGKAFAVVAPKWATSQRFRMPADDQADVKKLLSKQDQLKLRRGMERIGTFLDRVGASNQVNGAGPSVAPEGQDLDGFTPESAIPEPL